MNDICLWCDEPILPTDRRGPTEQPIHWECGLRSIAGGYNHQMGLCSCCGGTEDPDPPGLSRRDAARKAAELYCARHA